MDWTTLPLAPVGAGTMLGWVILMIFRGALIPRTVHEDRMADKDKLIDHLTATNAQLVKENTTLLGVGHTTEKVLMSLHEAAGNAEKGGDDVASS